MFHNFGFIRSKLVKVLILRSTFVTISVFQVKILFLRSKFGLIKFKILLLTSKFGLIKFKILVETALELLWNCSETAPKLLRNTL